MKEFNVIFERPAGLINHQRQASRLVMHRFFILVDNEPDVGTNYKNNKLKIR